MPEETVLLFIFNFRVGQRRLAFRAPINDPIAAVDQPFVIKLTEHFDDRAVAAFVHREAFTLPVAGGAQFSELLHDRFTVVLSPLPCPRQKILSANIFFGQALFSHLLHNLYFGGNGCVIRARQPERLIPRHSLVADQHVLQ